MKPSWNEAPEWANFLAMNQNGDWIWYEYEPNPRFGVWWISREGRYEMAYEAPKNWSESLEVRDDYTL